MWKWTVSQFWTKTTAKSEQIEWFQWEKEFRDRKLPMPWPKNIKFPRPMSSLAPTSLVRTKYLGNLICFLSMTYVVNFALRKMHTITHSKSKTKYEPNSCAWAQCRYHDWCVPCANNFPNSGKVWVWNASSNLKGQMARVNERITHIAKHMGYICRVDLFFRISISLLF